MTTLVTGAGLVGTAFCAQAIARGERVVFFDPRPREHLLHHKLGRGEHEVVRGDLLDLPGLVDAMRSCGARTVVHTASYIGRRVSEPLSEGLRFNVDSVLAIAEAARLAGVARLVHLSTVEVYDLRAAQDAPVEEGFARGGGDPYGISKAAQEMILEAYRSTGALDVVVLRPAAVFGLSGYWGGIARGEIVHTLLEKGFRGEPAAVPASQAVAQEYVYYKDVGRAVDLAATAPTGDHAVFNVSSGELCDFDRLVALARGQFPDLQVEVGPEQRPAPPAARYDIARAARHLGWRPQYDMAAAIADCVREMRDQEGYGLAIGLG